MANDIFVFYFGGEDFCAAAKPYFSTSLVLYIVTITTTVLMLFSTRLKEISQQNMKRT